MRLTSKFGTDVVSGAVSLALSAIPPTTARGLSGDSRASFLKFVAEGCVKNAIADPDISKLPRAALTAFCRCSTEYVADRATPAQLDKPDSPATHEIVAEATNACLRR